MDNNLVIYGGRNSQKLQNSDVYVLNLDNFTFHQAVQLESEIHKNEKDGAETLPALDSHCMIYDDTKFIVFGGYHESRRYTNDIFSFQIGKNGTES